MKVIRVDNYDREGPGFDPKLIKAHVTKAGGEEIARILNASSSANGRGQYFYKCVEDDYKLEKWQP